MESRESLSEVSRPTERKAVTDIAISPLISHWGPGLQTLPCAAAKTLFRAKVLDLFL
jgi:hypothetical protein